MPQPECRSVPFDLDRNRRFRDCVISSQHRDVTQPELLARRLISLLGAYVETKRHTQSVHSLVHHRLGPELIALCRCHS